MRSAPITRVHTMYMEMVNPLAKDWNDEEASWDMILDVKRYIQSLTGMIEKTSNEHYKTRLHTLKIHL